MICFRAIPLEKDPLSQRYCANITNKYGGSIGFVILVIKQQSVNGFKSSSVTKRSVRTEGIGGNGGAQQAEYVCTHIT